MIKVLIYFTFQSLNSSAKIFPKNKYFQLKFIVDAETENSVSETHEGSLLALNNFFSTINDDKCSFRTSQDCDYKHTRKRRFN
jgi:hypothetical protein